jgi:large subunit ribosomal protein L23
MKQERLMSILQKPLISEKSAGLADKYRQISFRVSNDATKPEIKKAVETIFNVQVNGVQTANVKGKQKRFGQMMGKRSNWKKAIVTLKEGHDIDFTGTE